MQSLFTTEDQRVNPQPGFWQRPKLPCTNSPLHSSWLRLKRFCGGWKRRFFCLSQQLLLVCKAEDSAPHKYVDLSWKHFEAFTETSARGTCFGFRLGSTELHEDLYADSQEALDLWIEHMQSVCLLTDLSRDFLLLRPIGRGTFAEVSLAENSEDGSFVAVKSVKKTLLSIADNLENHVQEIKALRTLQHPRIIRLLRVYEDDTCLHLVIDYLTGGDLCARILTRKCYSEPQAANLFKRILEVVAYIHAAGYVHRDIKPENILMAEDDCEFKLGDFGLATQIGLEGLHLRCGSPGYLAPEMLRRPTYGAQVDMFSCGVLLYYLLSGRMPFEGSSPSEVLTKNKECRMYFQPQLWSKISKDAIELVLKLTHPNPLQRLTPEQALTHAWLSTKASAGSVKAVRIAAGMRSITTCDHISHELMMRSLNKVEASTPLQTVAPSRAKKTSCLASLRLPVSEDPLDEGLPPVSLKGDSSPSPGSLVFALNAANK